MKRLTYLFFFIITSCSSFQKDDDPIREILTSQNEQYSYCFTQSTDHKEGAKEGKAVLSFDISQTGSVTNGKVMETTVRDPLFQECFLGAVTRLRFPKPRQSKIISVKQPFTFREKK